MAFFVALQQKTLTARWTNHAVQRTLLPERKVYAAAKQSAAKHRPINLGLEDAKWYLSLDKNGEAAIAILDSVYGAMFICCNNGVWLIKTVIPYGSFKQYYKPIEEKYLFELIDALGKSTNKVPLGPIAHESTTGSRGKKTNIPKTDASRDNARYKLEKMPRKNIMRLRKHLQIYGNPTGKPGAVSTEYAIESILNHMDIRGEYSLHF